ncbi:hypothetical protein SAY86_020572 [Trapa natans]|uniref:Uncharacterized protein n=1 Tax=Trapa natans TaxID=22666 RepID=A0AAN7LJ78_TRANT|nr:hypothetical protein SAY86_020572 [Trapa natans]
MRLPESASRRSCSWLNRFDVAFFQAYSGFKLDRWSTYHGMGSKVGKIASFFFARMSVLDADAAGKESSCLRTRLAEMSLRSSPDPSVFHSIK